MKRSEVVQIIKEYMQDAIGDFTGTFPQDVPQAEECLKALEDEGMLPPAVLRYIHQGNKSDTEPYRWEPEDE